jgi:hypothetical protein
MINVLLKGTMSMAVVRPDDYNIQHTGDNACHDDEFHARE